ncbi:MAG: hypothetical protein WC865_06495 [Bacteroidales bacterium]
MKALTMKVSGKVRGEDCPLQSDIYEAIRNSGNSFFEIQPIHNNCRKHLKICKQGSPVSHTVYLVHDTSKLYIDGINDH